jgi:hypothetical protein
MVSGELRSRSSARVRTSCLQPCKEWCRLTGVSRTATCAALSRCDLVAAKLGARTLVNVEAGLAWLASFASSIAHS